MISYENNTGSVIHRAGSIIVDPETVVRNGFIRVESGLITEVGQGKGYGDGQVIDHGSGTLIPALINAHTHLELGALKGKIPFDKGFRFWVSALISQRESMGNDVLLTAASAGIKELIESGSGGVGEISTLGLTRHLVLNSGLAGVWFREFLGNNSCRTALKLSFLRAALKSNFFLADNKIECSDLKNSVIVSLAGHAPHTTSPELLVRLKNYTRKKKIPLSIHVAESEDELIFLSTGKGQWANFLSDRGVDFSDWDLPARSPVSHLDNLGILDDKTLAVHLICSGKKDFEILFHHGVKVCLCLRSNKNLHSRLPDLLGMLATGIKPCLGTDSLAGVESLSMFDEMAFVADSFPFVPPAKILEMATINGARALDIDGLGSLVPGKRGIFFYAPVKSANRLSLLEKIVNGDFDFLCAHHLKNNFSLQ